MEGNAVDILRVLSLVAVWAIPAILILAVVAFVVAAPALTLAGAVLRLYEAVCDKLRRKPQAEVQVLVGTHVVKEKKATYDNEAGEIGHKKAAEKELTGTKS